MDRKKINIWSFNRFPNLRLDIKSLGSLYYSREELINILLIMNDQIEVLIEKIEKLEYIIDSMRYKNV